MSTTAPLILLLDDDPDFLEYNRIILEPQGYRICCAADQQQAWALMQQQVPHLIITDLMMESLDAGFAFARRVRQNDRFRQIPIIVATAVTSQCGFDFRPRSADDLAAMGVDAYFDKPVSPAALLLKVAELMLKDTPTPDRERLE
ncbi:MAG: Transcriptional regulatory protein AfsQ1 [Phycisphaerae bacterium]|nr:Transcriptional regulatory protein AfsQ1 [Phycisphaerae bacterium]